jgi:hypothetical protein
MFRVLARILAVAFLAGALVAGVLDLTRSIADSTLTLTPLADDMRRFAPQTLDQLSAFATQKLHPLVWDPLLTTLLAAPSWAIFIVFWLLFAIAGRGRRARWQEKFGA